MVGGQAYGVVGHMWQGWGHVAGCGGMWQGVGACGMGGGRVWGQVTEIWVCGRGSGLWCSWAHVVGWGHVAGCGGRWQGVGACGMGGGRVWGQVAEVWVCGRGQAYGVVGHMW